MKKHIPLFLLICLICAVALALLIFPGVAAYRAAKYSRALNLIQEGDYEKAKALLEELGEHENAKEQLKYFYYVPVSYRTGGHFSSEFTYDENNYLSKEVMSQAEKNDIIYEFTSDKAGNLLTSYNNNGDPISEEYIYDENGRPTKCTIYGENNNLSEIQDWIYGENGYEIKAITYKDKIQVSTKLSSYDIKGNLLKVDVSLLNGESSIVEYKYDANGNILKYIRTDNGVVIFDYEYTYDAEGNMTKSIDNRDNCIFEYTYNRKGNLIKSVRTTDTGDVIITKYTYDRKGNLLTTYEVYPDGTSALVDRWKYDKKGNMIYHYYSDGLGKFSVLEYTYDKRGNLVKKVLTHSDGDVSVDEYTYEGNTKKHVYTSPDGSQGTTVIEFKLIYLSGGMPDWMKKHLATYE